jgi:hypothetical protein
MVMWHRQLTVAVVATTAAQTLAHPQYMLNANKCGSQLVEGTPMMKGMAWATEEPGVAIVAARQDQDGALSELGEGAVFVAGETLLLGTVGLTQGGLAMSVTHGTFDATEASRSDALPQSIGCDSTRLSNWIGTHVEGGVDLTTYVQSVPASARSDLLLSANMFVAHRADLSLSRGPRRRPAHTCRADRSP